MSQVRHKLVIWMHLSTWTDCTGTLRVLLTSNGTVRMPTSMTVTHEPAASCPDFNSSIPCVDALAVLTTYRAASKYERSILEALATHKVPSLTEGHGREAPFNLLQPLILYISVASFRFCSATSSEKSTFVQRCERWQLPPCQTSLIHHCSCADYVPTHSFSS